MPRSPRTLTLALLLASSALPATDAGATFPPFPFPNSTVPPCITLVGSDGVTASATGAFVVIIRDLANNPVPGVRVSVDLSSATDLHFCADQLDPGLILDCPTNTVSALTDATGTARFTLLGGGNGSVGTGSLGNAGRIYADGFLIGSPTVSAYDLDGSAGVGANDLSLWLSDFGTGEPYGRSDYDCGGGLGGNDLSFWLSAYGRGAQSLSCGANCP